MIAVLAIADGADGEDDLGVGTMAAEQVDGSTQVVGTLVDGKLLLLEEGGGALLAVVDDFARFLQTVDVVGAEGDEGDSGEPPPIPLQLEGEPSFDCMKYRGGVVHHAIGVDGGAELFFHKVLADAVGKATAHKEHLLEGLYLEVRLGYIYNGTEFH
jgi:hypothetical protein